MAKELKKDKAFWEGKWTTGHLSRPWAHRGVSPEIVDAVSSGWFPSRAPVLDIGCGLGKVAAWFAKQGHATVGFDISSTAVARAAEMHAPLPPNLEFMALDACHDPLPNRQFRILIDCGCFHTIPPGLVRVYTRNIASVAAPGARMLLFIKAFRHGRPFGDPRETEMHVDLVRNAHAGRFDIARFAPTDLNAGAKPPLPGLVFWLVASGSEGNA
jgi:SAM-dependent methyltransferase